MESDRETCHPHWRHEPILVAHKTLAKCSTYVKFVVKFVTCTNNIAKLKSVKDYRGNNNPKILGKDMCESLCIHIFKTCGKCGPHTNHSYCSNCVTAYI